MQYLMCKNQKVLNTESYEIEIPELLPGYLMSKGASKEAFHQWMKLRYSSSSNTLARKLQGLAFGQGNRQRINRLTHALSFTDCYWLKEESERVTFQEISPYYTKFWDGTTPFHAEAAPTLYTDGFLPKEWRQSGELYKKGNLGIEIACIELCKRCGIPVEDGKLAEEGICVVNFTNPSVFLESAKASGRIDEYDFTDDDILREFGKQGVQMLVIDAIIGNGDRHAGNFGYLRDSDSGVYLGMAPLYDFDHALDAAGYDKKDILMSDMLDACTEYYGEVERVCRIACEDANEIFSRRAAFILKQLAKN